MHILEVSEINKFAKVVLEGSSLHFIGITTAVWLLAEVIMAPA